MRYGFQGSRRRQPYEEKEEEPYVGPHFIEKVYRCMKNRESAEEMEKRTLLMKWSRCLFVGFRNRSVEQKKVWVPHCGNWMRRHDKNIGPLIIIH